MPDLSMIYFGGGGGYDSANKGSDGGNGGGIIIICAKSAQIFLLSVEVLALKWHLHYGAGTRLSVVAVPGGQYCCMWDNCFMPVI